MAADRWTDAKNLLCVRLDTLGDVLLTTPAIRALKESLPGRRITLLTSPSGAEAAALVPEIDRVLRHQAPWMKSARARTDGRAERAMIESLRQEPFDGAVIFTVYSLSPLPAATICFLAEVPLRLAYCRENPYELLTDWIAEIEPQQTIRHEVRRQLDLAAAIGCRPSSDRLSLAIPPRAPSEMVERVQAEGVECERPWAVIHPGATAASRRYPAEHFVRVADGLAEMGLQVVFTGTAGEQELVEGIRRQMRLRSHSLVARLNLGQFAALLQKAALLVANNTGPVHVAAAVGAPVVDLYALTNPQHAPWRTPHRVLFSDVPCKYCYKSVCPDGHHSCLRRVTPESVIEASRELLEASQTARCTETAAETTIVGDYACTR
jgi:lipopolysaccharide heptosyltransferase II